MADSIEEIQKSKKKYLLVFGALLVGTVLTVLVASPPEFLWRLDVGDHGFDKWDGIIGLLIATTKATLVAAIFMHLNHEKKAIYWIFASGIVFVAWMGFLLALAYRNPIHDFLFYK
ncbi:MAG: cytochrome C oxidase subunit IV family protein [Luteolibacter sp.]